MATTRFLPKEEPVTTTEFATTEDFPTSDELDGIESAVFATKDKAEKLLFRLRKIYKDDLGWDGDGNQLAPISAEQAWGLQQFARYLRYSGEDLVKFADECRELAENIWSEGEDRENSRDSREPSYRATANLQRGIADENDERAEKVGDES
jgi:hypothetical protein